MLQAFLLTLKRWSGSALVPEVEVEIFLHPQHWR
jgi:hypothetical protein